MKKSDIVFLIVCVGWLVSATVVLKSVGLEGSDLYYYLVREIPVLMLFGFVYGCYLFIERKINERKIKNAKILKD